MAAKLRFFPRISSTAAPRASGSSAFGERKGWIEYPPEMFWSTGAVETYRDDRDLRGTKAYRRAWLAYACMRYRATKLIEPPLWIREETPDGEEWVTGEHPLSEVLERPNADMEMSDLLEATSLYLDSTGSALWVKSRDRMGRVVALYPYSGEDFTVKPAEGRIFGAFHVQTASGEVVFPPEGVVHFRNADPASPLSGAAPLDAALARLGIEKELTHAIKAGLRNSVVPGVTISFPANITPSQEQIQDIKRDLAAQWETARNHGKVLITGGGMTVQQNKLGFDGLVGGELSREIEAAVCACFQVHPAVIGAYVGLENSSDRHNMETAVELFYDVMAFPTWSRWERAITRGLLREADPNPLRFIRFDTSRVRALRDDLTEKAAISAQTRDVLTINERRLILGYPALEGDPRGDTLGDPVETVEAPKTARPVESQKAREVQDDTRWMLFDAVAKAGEYAWETAAHAQLEADREYVLDLAKRTLRTRRKDDLGPVDENSVFDLIRALADDLAMERAWADRMKPLIGHTARESAARAAVELGVSFDLLQPGILAWVDTRSAELVQSVTTTTRDAIRRALADGIEAGEGIPDITRRIQENTAFSRTRAELIARTETTAVTNGAQRSALAEYAESTGERVTKRWLSARDSRVRDEHREINGETREVSEAFSNGRLEPGEPNCRCTLVYKLEDA